MSFRVLLLHPGEVREVAGGNERAAAKAARAIAATLLPGRRVELQEMVDKSWVRRRAGTVRLGSAFRWD